MCHKKYIYKEIEAASTTTTSTTPKQLPCDTTWVGLLLLLLLLVRGAKTFILLKTAVVSAVNGYVLQPNPESNYQIQTKYPRINGKYQNGQR